MIAIPELQFVSYGAIHICRLYGYQDIVKPATKNLVFKKLLSSA